MFLSNMLALQGHHQTSLSCWIMVQVLVLNLVGMREEYREGSEHTIRWSEMTTSNPVGHCGNLCHLRIK